MKMATKMQTSRNPRPASICLFSCLVLLLLGGGCKTKPPPTRAQIHEQSGLTNLALTKPWKAAAVSTTPIQDNWLATFDDKQLEALVAEAITNNPDLRVAATKVAQAAEYVRLAKAARWTNM